MSASCGPSWLVIVDSFSDAAISGATVHRPGLRALLDGAERGHFTIVIAEALDRLSRDQADVATIFKNLQFFGVQIETISEGRINEMHVGLKGTMNALYLKDLADKTRRGLRGRVEAGKSGGGLCYGYKVVRAGGINVVDTGEQQINDHEAVVVRRIFHDYASGVSPEAIAKRLNAEGVRGPRGYAWGPSTIHGHPLRGTGILNNQLYIGQRVWNRLCYRKNPKTGKRISKLNPKEDWTIAAVPHLRIVTDEEWRTVKVRQGELRHSVSVGRNLGRANRPRFLFSGLIRCAVCGSNYVKVSTHRLACRGRREQGICDNRLTIRRDEVEQRVLTALQQRFFEPGPSEVFLREFAIAMNEMRHEARAQAAAAQRERTQIYSEIGRLIQALKDGCRRSDPWRNGRTGKQEGSAGAGRHANPCRRPPAPPRRDVSDLGGTDS